MTDEAARAVADCGDDERGRSEPSDDGSRLCTRCGLCCDGTLFGYAVVTDDEVRRLRHRLPLVLGSGNLEPHFELRCVALGPRGCDVYGERPSTCVNYACKLLSRLRRGEVTLDAAIEVVEKIQRLVDKLDGALPPGRNIVDRQHLLPPVAPTMQRELALIIGETWLDLKVLELMLERELREPKTDTAAQPPVT